MTETPPQVENLAAGWSSSGGATTLAYDYEGWISTITYPSSATNSFTYNGLDTRVGKVDSAGTTTYRRDGDDVLSPVLEAGGTKFTPGISRRTGTSSYFYHQDRVGSLVRQTNSTQGSLTSRQYDAFGNIAYEGGTWVGPFGFVGGEGYQEDSDSGLQLLGHRYYDSSTGRFLTRDPIKDGRNWYGYCENNPLKWVDASGLLPGWLEKTVDAGKWFWNEAGHVVKPGLKIITLVPAAITLWKAIELGQQEANEFREYKKAVDSSSIDPELGQELIHKNDPGMQNPGKVMAAFWKLLIDAS